jgi:hypothetical protein
VSGNANPTVFQVTTSDPADVIKLVTMKSQAPNEVLQLELGTGPSNRVGEIGEVKIGTDAADDDGQAHVLIYSEASVGFVEGTRLLNSSILGSLTDGVAMRAFEPLGLPGVINDLIVGGTIGDMIQALPTSTGTGGTIDRIQAGAITSKTSAPLGIYAGQRISRVIAGNLENVEIAGKYVASPYDAFDGYVQQLGRVELGTTVSGDGNFKGTIRAQQIGDGVTQNPGVFATGTMEGMIAVGGSFVTNSNPNLSPEMKFVNGLKGFVSFGTLNNSAGANAPTAWTAPVKIGADGPSQITLTRTSDYDVEDIGGGVAGSVPFGVLPESSSPSCGGFQCTVDPRFGGFELKYNGRFSVYQPSTPPVRLIRTNSNTDMTSCSTVSIEQSNTLIKGAVTYLPPGTYVVSQRYANIPNDQTLGFEFRSVTFNAPFGPAMPNAALDASWSFVVVDPCPGDFNNDGERNTADLVRLLSRFGTSQPCGAPEDMDVSFAVDTPDLTAFLGVFGQACTGSRPGAPAVANEPTTKSAPAVTRAIANTESSATTPGTTTEAGRPGNPAPMPPVLEALGFTSIEQYTAYVDNLSQEQLNAHIVQLLQTIEALNLP